MDPNFHQVPASQRPMNHDGETIVCLLGITLCSGRHPPSSVLSISFLLGLNDGPTTVPHYYTLEIWPSINLAHRWPPAFDHADNCTARPQPACSETHHLFVHLCRQPRRGRRARPKRRYGARRRLADDDRSRRAIPSGQTLHAATTVPGCRPTRLLYCRSAGDETLVTVGAR